MDLREMEKIEKRKEVITIITIIYFIIFAFILLTSLGQTMREIKIDGVNDRTYTYNLCLGGDYPWESYAYMSEEECEPNHELSDNYG